MQYDHKVRSGDVLSDVVDAVVRKARDFGESVGFTFWKAKVVAQPEDTSDAVFERSLVSTLPNVVIDKEKLANWLGQLVVFERNAFMGLTGEGRNSVVNGLVDGGFVRGGNKRGQSMEDGTPDDRLDAMAGYVIGQCLNKRRIQPVVLESALSSYRRLVADSAPVADRKDEPGVIRSIVGSIFGRKPEAGIDLSDPRVAAADRSAMQASLTDAARRRESAREDDKHMQNALIAKLPSDVNERDLLVKWCELYTKAIEHDATAVRDFPRIVEMLEGAGWKAGAATNEPAEAYEERDTYAAYVVGQVLSSLKNGEYPSAHAVGRDAEKFADLPKDENSFSFGR
jgi:hypothetical protein